MPIDKKTEISKSLIKIGFRPEELDDLSRICEAAARFYEERGIAECEKMAETWRDNFKLIIKTSKKRR